MSGDKLFGPLTPTPYPGGDQLQPTENPTATGLTPTATPMPTTTSEFTATMMPTKKSESLEPKENFSTKLKGAEDLKSWVDTLSALPGNESNNLKFQTLARFYGWMLVRLQKVKAIIDEEDTPPGESNPRV